MDEPAKTTLSTVSFALIEDLLVALRRRTALDDFESILTSSGIQWPDEPHRARISRDQIVRLYKAAAIVTGDEMMGLWSRPIRTGALKQICTASLGASSLGAGIFRMATFWNLVLDDYRLSLTTSPDLARLTLHPRGSAEVNRFGHMLLLKLTHGLASWLAGRELPVAEVNFVFPKPTFAQDYPVLFPAECRFSQPHSEIAFDRVLWANPITRNDADLTEFLTQAPRDWIFTQSREHALALRVREILVEVQFDTTLQSVAERLHLTPRTLMRRLDQQGVSFQSIKDSARRDLAMSSLSDGKTADAIAQDLGFSSVSTFHRGFRKWTGQTPAEYRKSLIASV